MVASVYCCGGRGPAGVKCRGGSRSAAAYICGAFGGACAAAGCFREEWRLHRVAFRSSVLLCFKLSGE
eukprot:1092695-Lingulodinium_polyedra.AAC.1